MILEGDMTYIYKCNQCGIEVDIVKPIAESERVEHCAICEDEMKRVYNSPAIATSDGFKR